MAESKSINLTKRAAYELRQKIIHGGLPGGTRLFEVAISEELQISRTPVREAMSRLAEEGLLERARGGGFQVRSFTFRDVVDAIELRGVLEGTAVRLASEQGAEQGKLREINNILIELDACFASGGAPIDFDSYSEKNAIFHTRLAELCESPVILRELDRVRSLPFASPSAFVLGQADVAGSHQSLVMAQAQHHAMVKAIEAREGSRAESIAREHARIARANLEEAFEIDTKGRDTVPGMALIVR
ncbi:GntR family transcriptional regulator [Pararhodobacter sp.]|uniref:GntR family transcriptional regulator n=1 Tax=Pararhodobacter sp. TaxID=2127056 RepID=UPI002AFF69B7|nr:GntR family transcriptional regulator [Pararhodobacter sp.]